MSLSELLVTHGSRELAEYEALYSIEPWGEYRQDVRIAWLGWRLGNVLKKLTCLWGSKDSEPFELKDFLPFREPQSVRESQPKTEADLKSALHQMCEL